jgi:phenylpropionate dioxygenase-like ring-hydroxylating dioxygenase large terminal subunit
MTQTADRLEIVPRETRIRRALEHVRHETTDQFEAVNLFQANEFTDHELAVRERDLVFGRVPSVVCHGSEVPRPNDFITVAMPRNRVLVVRQADGGVKVFVNHCRHRGAMLEQEPKGRCRLFSCQYHRWSYDTDGSLRAVTRDTTFGEFDRRDHGLVELPSEERHGFVWMIDDVGVDIDVAAWLGPDMDGILDGYAMDKLVAYRAEGFDEPVNWKVMQDAFLDGYHIQYAHPNTAAKQIHTNAMAVEDFGRHVRFVAPRKSIDRWLDEDPGDRSLAGDVTETHFLLPNSTLLRQPDHFQLLTFRPHQKEPGRSWMEMRLLVPPLEESGRSEGDWTTLWNKNWEILLAVLHREDFPLLRASQEALESANAGSMILGRNEYVNQVFHRELRKLLA